MDQVCFGRRNRSPTYSELTRKIMNKINLTSPQKRGDWVYNTFAVIRDLLIFFSYFNILNHLLRRKICLCMIYSLWRMHCAGGGCLLPDHSYLIHSRAEGKLHQNGKLYFIYLLFVSILQADLKSFTFSSFTAQLFSLNF